MTPIHYLTVILVATAVCDTVMAQGHVSTASQYPPPPVDRKDFAPIEFIESSGTTAIFTKVMVEPVYLEEIKDDIRAKLPDAHVRRIIAGSDQSDQTLMVMWHPQEAFRPAINDYFRVLDPMRGVKGTRTNIGVSTRFPKSYPNDTLIGWNFIKFEPRARLSMWQPIASKLVADQDVLEV